MSGSFYSLNSQYNSLLALLADAPAPSSAVITDNNTNADFYPIFVSGVGEQPLFADTTTTPISVNPNSGNFRVVDTLNLTQDAVAVGKSAGVSQGSESVAVGAFAGGSSQASASVAVGFGAGQLSQGTTSTAIGYGAGYNGQGTGCVSVGYKSGETSQGQSAVAVGNGAGNLNQGQDSIAIGNSAGASNQVANSIVLNASGSALNPTLSTLYVSPILGVALGRGVGTLVYNPADGSIVYSTN